MKEEKAGIVVNYCKLLQLTYEEINYRKYSKLTKLLVEVGMDLLTVRKNSNFPLKIYFENQNRTNSFQKFKKLFNGFFLLIS